jgi:hypothetical protein
MYVFLITTIMFKTSEKFNNFRVYKIWFLFFWRILMWRNINGSSATQCRIWFSHSGGYEAFYLLGYNAVQLLVRPGSLNSQWELTVSFPGPFCFYTIPRFRKLRALLVPASWWFLVWLTLQPWRRRPHVSPTRRLNFSGLHDVTSQETEFFGNADYPYWAK